MLGFVRRTRALEAHRAQLRTIILYASNWCSLTILTSKKANSHCLKKKKKRKENRCYHINCGGTKEPTKVKINSAELLPPRNLNANLNEPRTLTSSPKRNRNPSPGGNCPPTATMSTLPRTLGNLRKIGIKVFMPPDPIVSPIAGSAADIFPQNRNTSARCWFVPRPSNLPRPLANAQLFAILLEQYIGMPSPTSLNRLA